MLSVHNLSRPGLGPIKFGLAGGQVLAITGPSGAGKSLLLRALADLDPNTGEVKLDGEDRDSIAAPQWRRRVAYVAAESGWWADHVGSHFENQDLAAKLMPRVGLDGDALNWPVSRLSTGEKQRLSLVRTLIQKPQVLLLDEPTSALDEDSKNLVEDLLKSEADNGISLIIVSHDKAQVKRLNARVLQLKDGQEVTP